MAGVVAVGSLAALIRGERRLGDAAMLPPDRMRRTRLAVAHLAAGAMNLGTLGTLFVLTLFLQSVQHRSPLAAGVALVPLFAPPAVIAPFAGRLAGRVGARIPALAGLGLAAVGLVLVGVFRPDSHYRTSMSPAFPAWGTGLGLLTLALVAMAVGAVLPGRSGLVSAVKNTARQAGGAIGIAVAVAGAVAGQPGVSHFVAGTRYVAWGTAGLYVLTAAVLAVADAGLVAQVEASEDRQVLD